MVKRVKRIIKAIPFGRLLYQHFRELGYEQRFAGECYGCFRGVFETFAQAELSAPKTKSIGYNNPQLAEEYKVELKKHIQSYDYPVVFWLKQLINDNSKVFDFGGNVGIHFYSYEKYISYPSSLRWIVCDVPEIVKSGKELAKRARRDVVFTSNFEEASGANIFIASGSVQYVESLSASLSQLPDKPNHLLINRLPLYEGNKFVTLQNGGKVFYPQYVFNKKDFVSSIESLGYELIDIWEDLVDSCIIPSHPEKSIPFYHGLYFRLEC